MIKKSVDLHLKMIWTELQVSAITMALWGVAIGFLSIYGLFLSLLPLGIVCVCSYKIMIKLFRTSLYGEEAELYQSLPLTSQDILIGKALAAVIWQSILFMALMIPVAIGFFMTNSYMVDVFEGFVEKLLCQGMMPWQIGILAGLAFPGLIIVEFTYCMFVIAVQMAIQKISPGFASGMSDLTGIIIAGILYTGISYGLYGISDLVFTPNENYFYMIIAAHLCIAAAGAVLYLLCRENLQKTYEYKGLS